MEIRKKTQPLGQKTKACLTPQNALILGTKHLQNLGEIRRKLLSHFEPAIKAYQYKKMYIWIISFCSSHQNSDSRLTLYVDVKNSAAHDEIIDFTQLKSLENVKTIRANNKTLWYDGTKFSLFKNETVMNLAECNDLWQREKEKHIVRLKSHNFTIYPTPKPMFERETPIYVIAFHHQAFTENVEVLIVHPNVGRITTHIYSKYRWRKMVKTIGAGIVKENARITITAEGFKVEAE